MPGGSAVKPGDVVKAMNGKTIRIERPDHDGRVVLADALAYAACFAPKLTINVATLSRKYSFTVYYWVYEIEGFEELCIYFGH